MPSKVLMIDDEERLCEVVKRGLELMGAFEVDFATSGKEGLSKARRWGPDVILLDIRMPKMDGLEVLRTLKAKYPLSEIPVIMLSAILDDSTKKECNYQYGEEYIEKPVDIAELKNRIEAVLRRTGRLSPPPPSTAS